MSLVSNHIKAEKFRNILFLFLASIIFLFNFAFKVNLNAVGEEVSITTQNLFEKHNTIRNQFGLSSLVFSRTLYNSALNKGKEMLAANCWSHFCPDGNSPWDFFDDAGYNYIYAGENLAEGFYNSDTLMEAWMDSETHRRNVLNDNFSEIGIAVVAGDYQGNPNNLLVVVHFGKREIITNEPFIKITEPSEGESVQESFDVKGTALDVEEFTLKVDNIDTIKGQIDDGLFTVRVNNLQGGRRVLSAYGNDSFGTFVGSNSVNVNVQSENPVIDSFSQISSSSSTVSISPELKNAINVVFIVIIAGVFFIDLLILSRTTVLKEQRSFSHYHFILLIITGFSIAIGTFGGRIINGTSV